MPKDNFSNQADLYARYRPHYPQELYDFIYTHTHKYSSVWDCATGNGQVASVLSEKFDKVLATDISQKQLDQALKENIRYSIGSGEQSGLTEKVDLITVGQAIHWFDHAAFYQEVKRLSHPLTTLAYWGYELMTISEEIDPLILRFYNETIGKYWDPERKFLEDAYKTINFPLRNIKKESFTYSVAWNLDHLSGYLSSWSSVQKYIKKHGHNPVDGLAKQLSPYWQKEQIVYFPIFLILGQVS